MNKDIIIVSGLPRSGTSMMMKMLETGGMELMKDNARKADIDNPKGYFEYENVKNLKNDSSWIQNARGKAVKIISMLLYYLPPLYSYKIIFIKRDMNEIIASQRKMLERSGQKTSNDDDNLMLDKFKHHLDKITDWINNQINMDCLYINYNDIINDTIIYGNSVNRFLDNTLNVDAMVSAVDPSLYRNISR